MSDRGLPVGSLRRAMRHDRVVRALVDAATSHDERGLRRLLHRGVTVTVDGGGMVPAPDAALSGSEAGAYLAAALTAPSAVVCAESVNGMLGLVLRRGGRVTGVLAVDTRGGRVFEAWLVINPCKLSHWSS